MATEAQYRSVALSLPGVIEEPYYGSPVFKLGKVFMASLKADGETLVVRMSREEREFRLATEPELFFVTPHYNNWDGVLVHLSKLDRERLGEVLQDARDYAALKPQPRPRTPRKKKAAL